MALMVSDVLVVFDHMRHELTLMAYAIADDESDLEAAYASAVETLADLRETAARPGSATGHERHRLRRTPSSSRT